MTLLELCLFETGKESSWGDCTANFRFFAAVFLSFSLYVFPYSGDLVLKHHFAIQFAWLLNMCSRGILLASLNSSTFFSLFFFIMYPQYFLSRRASALVHPHRRSLLSLTMENMCFATTFTRWEGSARKDGSEISVWSFPFGDLRTWPRATLDGCLSTARIVISLSLLDQRSPLI